LAVHRFLSVEEGGGRNGSLRAAYSCEEELVPKFRGEEGRKKSGGGRVGEEEVHRSLLPSSSGCSSDASSSLGRHSDPPYRPPQQRHRKTEVEHMSSTARCCFGLLTLVAQVLLHGALALTLYWVLQYRWQDKNKGLPFAWRGSEPGDREKQWNLHPVLMMTGLIYCSGQAMLVYRSCRCCRRIWNKLLHTMFHLMAMPCVALGFLAAWDYHQDRKDKEGNPDPIPHFYSIHSWLGLATMAVYAIQFVVGIFSFLLLLCCESATAGFRAALVPLHSTFGTSTFLLAIATAVAGLTEKAFFELSVSYQHWHSGLVSPTPSLPSPSGLPYSSSLAEEALLVNLLAAILACLGLSMPILLWTEGWRQRKN